MTTKVIAALKSRDPIIQIASPDINDAVIINGTKHKKQILKEYEDKYGSQYPDSIVTQKKGKHINASNTITCVCMRPSRDKYYQVEELTVYNIITTVIKEYCSSFSNKDVLNISRTSKNMSLMIPNFVQWLQVDFSPL
jgi:hypothetical protein